MHSFRLELQASDPHFDMKAIWLVPIELLGGRRYLHIVLLLVAPDLRLGPSRHWHLTDLYSMRMSATFGGDLLQFVFYDGYILIISNPPADETSLKPRTLILYFDGTTFQYSDAVRSPFLPFLPPLPPGTRDCLDLTSHTCHRIPMSSNSTPS